jgi:hypothetical protein
LLLPRPFTEPAPPPHGLEPDTRGRHRRQTDTNLQYRSERVDRELQERSEVDAKSWVTCMFEEQKSRVRDERVLGVDVCRVDQSEWT